MIFDLSTDFIKNTKPSLLSDLVAQIISHEHYLTFPGEVVDLLWKVVETNSSSTQTDMWLQNQEYLSPTTEVKTYLTTVSDTGYSYDDLMIMASKPSVILLENTREWDVYKSMIDAYCSDSTYGNLFRILQRASDISICGKLVPRQAGGFNEMPHCITDLRNTEGYGDLLKKKLYVVFDRDTTSATAPLNENKKPLFQKLCGKTHLTVTDADNFSLSQPEYIWHMWYRRAIENYFPDRAYLAIGYTLKRGAANFESNYYGLPEDSYAHGRVSKKSLKKSLKNDLGSLAAQMTKALYDVNLQSFTLGGITVNEIQLFLLKLLKVI